MSDPTGLLRKAFFDKLVAASLGVPVHSRAPDNLDPPFVVLGEIALGASLTKDGGLFEASVEIISVVDGRSPVPSETVMAGVFSALQGQTITATGASFTPPFLQSSGARSNEEKTLFFGLQSFSVTATAD
jgi:hypothetical protein